jgi:hypothetical protein
MSKPNIKPIKIKEYDIKQSKYDQVGSIPVRSILLGASGSGKGILLQNMIMDIYHGCFERVYIFSPSINVDMNWKPVKEYIKKNIHSTGDDLPFYYDHYDEESLATIIKTHTRVCEYQKTQKETKRLFMICIIIDDFADSPEFSRNSKLLHSLFTRGRHSGISTIVSTQKFTAIHPIIRCNATEMYVFRLRSFHDLGSFIEEVSALINKKTLLQMYQLATEQAFGFLYVKMTSKDKNKMFMINYDKYMMIDDEQTTLLDQTTLLSQI